jgi:hypothetical protein
MQRTKNHTAQNLTLAGCETFQTVANLFDCAILYCGLYLQIWSLAILASTYLATMMVGNYIFDGR